MFSKIKLAVQYIIYVHFFIIYLVTRTAPLVTYHSYFTDKENKLIDKEK